MPILAVTIFASLYGTAAVALACAPLFSQNTPPALTTGMAGGRASLSPRVKAQKKSKWWKKLFARKNRAGENVGASEAPPPRRRTPPPRPVRPSVSLVNVHGDFVVPDVSATDVFQGFTAEHPAAHVAIEYRNSVPQQQQQQRQRQQHQQLKRKPKMQKKLNSMARKLKQKLKSAKPTPKIQPNVASFSRDYKLIRTFKQISQGIVHLVRHRRTGERFIIKQMLAIKGLRPGKIHAPEEAEVLISGIAPHKNILRLVDVFTYWHDDVAMANLVFEYCDAGDVEDLIKINTGKQMPEAFILHFISSMIDVLAFLHHGDVAYDAATGSITRTTHRQKSYLHRDLKPGNVFLQWNSDSQYGLPTVILGDFGQTQPANKNYDFGGTNTYMAPELELQWFLHHKRQLSKSDYVNFGTTKIDMYAFGVSVWEVMTGAEYKPGGSIRDGFMSSPVSQHGSILIMLEGCLSAIPERRPEATELHRVSAELKAQLKAWYDQGGRVSESLWPNPLRSHGWAAGQPSSRPEPQFNFWPHFSQCSSHYSPIASGPPPSSRFQPGATPAPQFPRLPRCGRLNSSRRAVFNQSPTIALFPPNVDTTNLMPQNRPSSPSTTTTGGPYASPETLRKLFAGEFGGMIDTDNTEVSSTTVEVGDLGRDEPVSAFSSSSSEGDDELYI